MNYQASCGLAGCGYVARCAGMEMCAAWLWHHHAVAHRGLRDLGECRNACALVEDGLPPLGYPGTASARQWVPEKRAA